MSDETPECPKCEAVDWADKGPNGRIKCESCGWTPKRHIRQRVKEVRS